MCKALGQPPLQLAPPLSLQQVTRAWRPECPLEPSPHLTSHSQSVTDLFQPSKGVPHLSFPYSPTSGRPTTREPQPSLGSCSDPSASPYFSPVPSTLLCTLNLPRDEPGKVRLPPSGAGGSHFSLPPVPFFLTLLLSRFSRVQLCATL